MKKMLCRICALSTLVALLWTSPALTETVPALETGFLSDAIIFPYSELDDRIEGVVFGDQYARS